MSTSTINKDPMSPIIFFDGVCNLCNNSVDLVIRNDKKGLFRYSSLQSEFAKNTLPNYNVNPEDLDSIALLMDGKVYQKSTAALKIAGKMSGIYPLLKVFLIVPPFIRNFMYDIIARNRYRWFGKKDSCRIPSANELSLFIE